MKILKYLLYILLSSSYLIYVFIFKAAIQTNSAVMQLQDSTAAYAIGAKWAIGSILDTIFIAFSFVIIIYSCIRLITIKPTK